MPFPGTQQLQFNFSGGLDSTVAEFSLDQPNLQVAKNAVYNQYGQIDQRAGFSAFSTSILGGGNIIKGKALGVFENELVLMDGTNLYSYDPSNQTWLDKGIIFSTINDQVVVLNTKIATQANPDVTSLNGLQLYVWEDDRPVPVGGNGAGIRYEVINISTGTSIVHDRFVYPLGFRPKTIAYNDQFNIYYQASSQVLCLQTVSTNLPQVITPLTQIISDGFSSAAPNNTGMAYDVCLRGGYPSVAYAAQAGINLLYDDSFSTPVPGVKAGVIATCINSTNNQQWIAYTSLDVDSVPNGTFVYSAKTNTITQIDTLSAINISIIEDINLGNLNITYEVKDGSGDPHYIKNAILTWKNVVIPVSTTLKVGLASKPFQIDNNLFVNTVGFTTLQSTYFTLCLTQNMTAIAKHSPQNGGNYRGNALMAQCDSYATNDYIFAGQRKGPFTSFQNSETTNLGVTGYTINFDAPNAFNNVSASNNLHVVGGIKKIYDGVSFVEDNFNFFPELPDGYSCDVTLVNGGGNLGYSAFTDGYSYQWLAIYTWTDNKNQVQRSGPGIANAAVTTQAGQGATIVVPTLTITDKMNARSPVSIEIYRTIGPAGTVFYKITDDNNPLVNNTAVNTVTFTDTFSDADIAANENLYTGSQLGNIAPPACSLISLYQNRLMINSTEDKNVVWYSQNKFEQDQYNTLPLDWNTSFVEGVISGGNSASGNIGSDITCIGLLGTSLAIFKETSILLLQGDGPNALDSSGQFNDAQLLVSNVGCTNSNSLVFITQTPKLPGGLLFQSKQGIYLLGLDNNLYNIGSPVSQYNNLTITSANLVPSKNMVVFTSLEGVCLVYNYFFNTWTTWEHLPAIDAVVWQDQLVLLQTNGTCMIEDLTNTIFQDTFGDGVTYPIEMVITTPWVKLNGANNLQGRMAVYNALLLGTLHGPCNLQIQVAFDYDPSILESVIVGSSMATNRWGGLPVWASPGVWASPQFSNYQFQINLEHFRGRTGSGCQAIQLTFTTLNPDATAAYSFNGLAFEVMPLAGPYNVPTQNKVRSG